MHGIMLRRQGYNVHVLEQESGDREAHMAGVGAAADVLQFLQKYDVVDQPLGIPSECLQSLDTHGKITPFLKATRVLTSWDALYYRLRANFEETGNRYYRFPTDCKGTREGQSSVLEGKRVKDISVNDGRVFVVVQDLETSEETMMQTDMLIGADGANSTVRRIFMPHAASRPQYSGYVAWRGVVPESDISETTRKIFQYNVTYFLLPREHVIVYDRKPEYWLLWLTLFQISYTWGEWVGQRR